MWSVMLASSFLGMFLNLVAASDQLKEIFRDDFNGKTLDRGKWHVSDMPSTFGAELQYFLSENIVIGNGSLRIRAHSVSDVERKDIDQKLRTNPFWTKQNFTSGMIYSQEKFSFKYGQVEWRAKVAFGKGILSNAFLMSPHCPVVSYCEYWPPSVHAINARGHDTHTANAKLYYKDPAPRMAEKDYEGKNDFSLDFHIYKIIWAETFVAFHIDDTEILVLTDPKQIPSAEMQLVINLVVGGPLHTDPVPDKSTVFPADFFVDYVVVRQYDNQSATETSETSILAPLLGTVIPCIVLMLCGVSLYASVRYRRREIAGNMRKLSGDTGTADLLTMYSVECFRRSDTQVDAAILEYVQLLEIPLANITISDTILGCGQYGIVRKGVATGLRGQDSPVDVAIKTVKDRNDPLHIRQLIEEIRMMSRTARHLNILNLLGVVLKGETLLLLEFCRYGCLLDYLKTHRGRLFYNHTTVSGDLLNYDEAEARNLQTAVDEEAMSGDSSEGTDGQILSTKSLMCFTFQLSRGMEFLTSRSIIHRDLAARNVLVASGRVVKICDFGMAKQMGEYVQLDDQVALPVRWMAPEALTEKVFSIKSDVWSFGVLMWEIFSLGELPYAHIRMSIGYVVELVHSLRNGEILQRAVACPTVIYDTMTACWSLQPELRPDFTELSDSFKSVLGIDSAAYLSLQVSHKQFNEDHRQLLDKIASLPNNSLA